MKKSIISIILSLVSIHSYARDFEVTCNVNDSSKSVVVSEAVSNASGPGLAIEPETKIVLEDFTFDVTVNTTTGPNAATIRTLTIRHNPSNLIFSMTPGLFFSQGATYETMKNVTLNALLYDVDFNGKTYTQVGCGSVLKK